MAAAGLLERSDVGVDGGAGSMGAVAADDVDCAVGLLADAERATAQAAVLLAGLDGTGLAQWHGYPSLERLVAHRTGRHNQSARALLRVARHLKRFPTTAAALEEGRISWTAAETLTQTAAGLDNAYGLDEAELLSTAEACDPEDLVWVCRLWRTRADQQATADDAERRFEQRGVWLQFAFDGSCHGRLTLDPVAAETVLTALETPPDPTTTVCPPRSLAQRRADRLADICHHTLTNPHGGSGGGGGGGATVDVVIDIETLAGATAPLSRIRSELALGGPIHGPGLDRLLCDASFRALVTDGSRVVLAYNRATPDIPPALRRAVKIRDRSCTFAGCDRPHHWCDLHHLVPRSRGGPTTAENLTLLCRFHHGLVHEGGWQLTRAPDGTITTTSP